MLPNGPFSQSWWWFSMICSFPHLPANTAASFRVSKDHSNKRQLELQPAKNTYQEQSQILSTCHFQLGVMCLCWVEMWLCCEPWVLPVCYISGPHKTPTVYQDCTSQDQRYHTYDISKAQPCTLWVFFFLPWWRTSLSHWGVPQQVYTDRQAHAVCLSVWLSRECRGRRHTVHYKFSSCFINILQYKNKWLTQVYVTRCHLLFTFTSPLWNWHILYNKM